MALGGGYWLMQNKVLPGTYNNFVSKEKAYAESVSRGFATMALDLDWGATGGIVRVEQEEFQTNSQAIFGYEYGHDKMKGLRDLFMNTKTLFLYRLNSGGAQATCDIAKARFAGVRGNDISVSVQKDIDDTSKYTVVTFLTTDGITKEVDKQERLASPKELKNNDYVIFTFKDSFTVALGTKLTGGTNGSPITTGDYQKYLGYIEPYYFNCIGYVGADATIQSLLIAFAKRTREATGQKFQVVMHNVEKANYEGIISTPNKVLDEGAEVGSIVYWLTGAEASCEINKSCTNKIYDGEYKVDTNYKQSELTQFIKDGMLVFHNVTDGASGNIKGDVRILQDINTFTEFSKAKTRDFSHNQVVRVLDNLAYDVARLFNKMYLGKEVGDALGYAALWGDVVFLLERYQKIRAIKNFDDKDVKIPCEGETKESAVLKYEVRPTVAMEKLYATTTVA